MIDLKKYQIIELTITVENYLAIGRSPLTPTRSPDRPIIVETLNKS
ncbi:hypothetical protein QUB60_25855 [Microcoleus sp. A2-C5]